MRLKTIQRRKAFSLTVGALGIFIFLSFTDICVAESPAELLFSKGETITYAIKKLKFNVGEAKLVFDGLVDFNGRPALLITFSSEGFRFFDNEKIYLDPETFYPFLIERDLNIFGRKEKIVEFYDTKYGKVRIVKTVKGKRSEQIIEKGGRFENIYGFIYRYRQHGQFEEGEELDLHLPTRDVTFELVGKGKFTAEGREFDAYHMKGASKKYKVWFDSSSKKVPLMIDGAVGFGHTSMVMKDYVAGSRR